jgi:hypothetical protein
VLTNVCILITNFFQGGTELQVSLKILIGVQIRIAQIYFPFEKDRKGNEEVQVFEKIKVLSFQPLVTVEQNL